LFAVNCCCNIQGVLKMSNSLLSKSIDLLFDDSSPSNNKIIEDLRPRDKVIITTDALTLVILQSLVLKALIKAEKKGEALIVAKLDLLKEQLDSFSKE
jgi:C4-type Zn-finger protein